MHTKETYWQLYFDEKTVARANAIRTTYQVSSTRVTLHVDAYEQPQPNAPLLIFNHGGGGYARMFTPLALALFDQGYTVLLPDQIGQGFSGGTWRELSIDAFMQNLVDVARWARQRFGGSLFMAGASLGGGLTYHAAAVGAPVDGIICHNLYEFGRPQDALAVSRFAWVTAVRGLPAAIEWGIKRLAALLPNFPIPYRLLGRFERMVDRHTPDFYAKWQTDPVPMRWVTLSYMRSLFTTKPAVAYGQNTLPILVINPTRDKMVAPAVTRRNYERLSGPVTYAELAYGHWSLSTEFVREWVALCHTWCQSQMSVASEPDLAAYQGNARRQIPG